MWKVIIQHYRLQKAFITLVCFCVCGCASFKSTGYCTVSDETRRVGVEATTIKGFGPPTIINIPTSSSPFLQIYFCKILVSNVKYETATHQEEVLRKKPTRIEKNAVILAGLLGATTLNAIIIGNPGVLAIGALAVPFLLLKSPSPPELFKYVPLSGSSDILVTYKDECSSVPAISENLVMDGLGSTRTNSDGIASFEVKNPLIFDQGIVMHHLPQGDTYVIHRIAGKRTITEDWVETAKQFELAVNAAEIIKSGVEAAFRTLKPRVVAIEIAVGIFVNLAINVFGTSTETYYDWVVISKQ